RPGRWPKTHKSSRAVALAASSAPAPRWRPLTGGRLTAVKGYFYAKVAQSAKCAGDELYTIRGTDLVAMDW
ncbi:MAG TPA: hypothetical protein DD675_23555, partial [Raoultella ornithinolytica]|nr:hypothetical protein [Raoultella ornithinolytica]